MIEAARKRQSDPAPMATIRIPDPIEKRLAELVGRTAERLGETPERARRAVEIAVLSRGIEALEGDEKR